MKRQLLIEIICGLLILLFAYTAISKLANFDSFRATLRLMPMAGSMNEVVTWAIPITELIITALLFIQRSRLTGLYGSLLLLLSFTGYMGYLLLSAPKNLPCSCGGVLRQMIFRDHILFNVGFIILTMTGIILYTYSKNIVATSRKQAENLGKSKH